MTHRTSTIHYGNAVHRVTQCHECPWFHFTCTNIAKMNLIATQWPRRLQTVDFIQITKQNSILQDRIPARECNHGRNESCMHSKLRTRKRGGEVGRAGKHSEHGRGTGSLNTETVNPFITWASRPNYLLRAILLTTALLCDIQWRPAMQAGAHHRIQTVQDRH